MMSLIVVVGNAGAGRCPRNQTARASVTHNTRDHRNRATLGTAQAKLGVDHLDFGSEPKSRFETALMPAHRGKGTKYSVLTDSPWSGANGSHRLSLGGKGGTMAEGEEPPPLWLNEVTR